MIFYFISYNIISFNYKCKEMINTNDTQDLDNKKKEQSKPSSQSAGNIVIYLKSIIKTIVYIIIYLIFGAIVLFECKLAQANILPTDLECYPYTETNPTIDKIATNIFVTNTDPQESLKLSFPYDKSNTKNMLLDMFRKYKQNPSSSFFINYIIAILEGLICYSNNAITGFFNLLNGTPELFIVLCGPIITLFYFCLVPFFGLFVLMYQYFAEMKWLFKENANTSSNGKPNWKEVNLLDPTRYGSSFILVFVFFILFWVLLFTFMPLIPFIIFFICFSSSLCYKGEMNNKEVSLAAIIKSIFKYYKLTIVIIFTIFIVMSAFSNLGPIAGAFSIVVVVLMYFNIIPIKLFDAYKPTNLTPLVSFDQAERKCVKGPSKPTSFLNKFQNFFDSQRGGNLTKELKKLNKKLYG